jgi:hypothetical protein
MANDDWRLRIELDEEAAGGLMSRLHASGSAARDLVRELEQARLVVSRDESTVFVYAGSAAELDRARAVIDADLASSGLEPEAIIREHWLDDEDRWDDEPPHETDAEEALASGYAPWEVRIPCSSHGEAKELAERLEGEGYGVVRRWSYVIAGTATEEEARALAAKLHGEAEPGGELLWEVAPANPWAVFGGLSSYGTPM